MKAGLITTQRGEFVPHADTVNDAGGKAYLHSDEHALAQIALTGTLSDTFYAGAEVQLEKVLELSDKVSPEYLAKLAIYARTKGFMKDMPAILTAKLASRDASLLKRVFHTVIDNGKMLRNFVQMIRSGITGRKSLGTVSKRLVLEWLEAASPHKLLNAYVGNNPSLGDIVKMVHPKSTEPWRNAFWGWCIGKLELERFANLPESVRQLDAFRKDHSLPVPTDTPLMLLMSMDLTTEHWLQLIGNMTWTQLRMNLNVLQRNGVFENVEAVKYIAGRLKDADEIHKAKVFPYQLLSAYVATQGSIPMSISLALQDALEIALDNVPELPEGSIIAVDVSGSMKNSVSAQSEKVHSKVRCIDVAALYACALLRKNPTAKILGFDDGLYELHKFLNPRDSVMTNAKLVSDINGGATRVGVPLYYIKENQLKPPVTIIISDNESWSRGSYMNAHLSTELMQLWQEFRASSPESKMVLIDITPSNNSQAKEMPNVLNIGGFSDEVFTLVSGFANGTMGPAHWVGEINAIEIPTIVKKY